MDGQRQPGGEDQVVVKAGVLPRPRLLPQPGGFEGFAVHVLSRYQDRLAGAAEPDARVRVRRPEVGEVRERPRARAAVEVAPTEQGGGEVR